MGELKKVFINAKYNDSEGKLGNRWKDSKTEIVLTAKPNPATGRWNTTRGSDIDSSGGTDSATYNWNHVEHVLRLVTVDGSMSKTHVELNGFNDFKTGHKGNGTFNFRNGVQISWEIGVMEYS